MPVYRLFHVSPDRDAENRDAQVEAWFSAQQENPEPAIRLGILREVARVEAMTIDDVFGLTNHIERRWQENEGVLEAQAGARSTSVGDIVIDTETQIAWLCARFGWKALDPELAEMFRAGPRPDETRPGPELPMA